MLAFSNGPNERWTPKNTFSMMDCIAKPLAARTEVPANCRNRRGNESCSSQKTAIIHAAAPRILTRPTCDSCSEKKNSGDKVFTVTDTVATVNQTNAWSAYRGHGILPPAAN